MHLLVLLALAQAGAPLWEAKAPSEYTDEELLSLLRSSPWAQMHHIPMHRGRGLPRGGLANPGVHVYLASAEPLREAERELRRRQLAAAADPEFAADSEYEEFLDANPGRYIVLAVQVLRPELLDKETSVRKMEQDSRLKISGRKYEMVGHFPPTRTDPYLRLIFPRDIRDGDKEISFELYLPGVPLPFRNIKFILENVSYRGRLEL
jgi:hypothetical protein